MNHYISTLIIVAFTMRHVGPGKFVIPRINHIQLRYHIFLYRDFYEHSIVLKPRFKIAL